MYSHCPQWHYVGKENVHNYFSRSSNMDHRDMEASENNPKAERELREKAMELIKL